MFKNLMLIGLVLFCFSIEVSAKPIIAGYDAISRPEHLDAFKANGINTHLRKVDFATKMKLRVDENGKVVSDGIEEAFKNSILHYVNDAAERDVDIYFIASFTKNHLKQLQELGPYKQAVIQGPTRYHSNGVKPAPAPFEKKYWLGQLLQPALFVAEISKDHPNIKGFLIDVEMYAGHIMWRDHTSFDDDTFSKVTESLGVDANSVDSGNRYNWLLENSLLEKYLSTEEDMVAGIATEFRKEVDKINPDFSLGILPYEANWFYDGWVRGFASGKPEALVFSESEYGIGFTSSAMAKSERLEKKIGNVRYLPGLMPKDHSLKMFGYHAAKCIEKLDGYWIFTTYSLWQPQPEKLWGAYLIQADKQQYWDLLRKVNTEGYCDKTISLPAFYCENYSLLTGNKYYEGEFKEIPLKVNYNPQPDVELFKSEGGSKLFDGCVFEPFGTVAWYVKKDLEAETLIDMGEDVYLEKIAVTALSVLSRFHSVKKGTITVLTSLDNGVYYPLMESTVIAGGRKGDEPFVCDDLGIKARYIKIVLKALETKKDSVLVLSEVAMWGEKISE